VGFVGCSFHCGFCQNWHISQSTDAATRFVSPEDLVDIARRERSFAIAYTYSEPLVHFEYVLEASQLARRAGLKNVLVTNGYLNSGPAGDLLPFVDAANVDLKAWDPEFYRRETGGKLEEVKRFIREAAGRIHLEVTTLVIPTKNDDPAQIEGIAGFIAGLDPGIPLHLSAYYPQHRYTVPPTPPSTVRRLAEVARRTLRHVYVGNLGAETSDTTCSSCGNVLVRRVGWHVEISGVQDGKCSQCGAKTPIIGA
jgi:pyruvate formate lyase activating enzyme